MLPELLEEASAAGVWGLITVSTTSGNARTNLDIAREHPNIWCTSGVHPLYADQAENGIHDWAEIVRVAAEPECVAFGELGLDNHHPKPAKSDQLNTLHAQLDAIRGSGIDKPIVVHCREAFDELIPILRESGLAGDRFVFHCFTAGPDEARQCLDLGAMISFTGVVTYKSAAALHEAARLCPRDRIMVETDAPYLSPVPHRGTWPCRPAWVAHTGRRLAELHQADHAEFERQLDDNAIRFFGVTKQQAGTP